MIGQSEKKRLVAGSWFVGLALAFALSFGCAGQAFADDQDSDTAPATSLSSIENTQTDDVLTGATFDQAMGIGDLEETNAAIGNVADTIADTTAGTLNEERIEEDIVPIAGEISKGQPTVIADGSGNGAFDKPNPHTLPTSDDMSQGTGFAGYDNPKAISGNVPNSEDAGLNADEQEGNGSTQDESAESGDQTPNTSKQAGDTQEQTTDAPEQTTGPVQASDDETANATTNANATANETSTPNEKEAADKARASSKASNAKSVKASRDNASSNAEQGYAPRESTFEYATECEQAASEVKASNKPEEQPAETETIKAVRWSGGSGPAVPVVTEASTNRASGTSSSSNLAITLEEGQAALVGASSLSNRTQNRQGALLYSKSRCRSP